MVTGTGSSNHTGEAGTIFDGTEATQYDEDFFTRRDWGNANGLNWTVNLSRQTNVNEWGLSYTPGFLANILCS